MIIRNEKRRGLLKTVSRGVVATALTLVFPACNYIIPEMRAMYGPGPDWKPDVTIHGKVLSESTNEPIPGIKVSVKDLYSDANTDENGDFVIYLPRQDEYKLKFEDVDGAANGSFQQKKMKITLENTSAPLDIILENIILDERNEE